MSKATEAMHPSTKINFKEFRIFYFRTLYVRPAPGCIKADISGEIVTMLHHCCRSPASPPPGNMDNQRLGMSN